MRQRRRKPVSDLKATTGASSERGRRRPREQQKNKDITCDALCCSALNVRRSSRSGERALDEKSWGERTKTVQHGGKTRREKKKRNGAPESPPSAANSNQGRVNNALSARRKPLLVVSIKERERKRTLGSPIFDIMP